MLNVSVDVREVGNHGSSELGGGCQGEARTAPVSMGVDDTLR